MKEINFRTFLNYFAGQGKIKRPFEPIELSEGFTYRMLLLNILGFLIKSMGVTGMLNQALLALANNFENVADIALKLASIIAGALIGKAIF